MLRGRNAKTGCLTLHASSSRSSSKVLDSKGRSYYCALGTFYTKGRPGLCWYFASSSR